MTDIDYQLWEVHDRYGNRIYMTAERWRHITESRPWMKGYHDEILETLRQGRRKQDPMDPTKYKYYWPCGDLLPAYTHFVVVVVFREETNREGVRVPHNFVATAWAVFIYSRS